MTNKKPRIAYSELPQERKDSINARRRQLRLEKKAAGSASHRINPQHSTQSIAEFNINATGKRKETEIVYQSPESVVNALSRETETSHQSTHLMSNLSSPEDPANYDLGVNSVTEAAPDVQDSHSKVQPNKKAKKQRTTNPTLRKRTTRNEPSLLPAVSPCRFCKAKRFAYEPPGFCCSKGEVQLHPINIPENLLELYQGRTPESTHFLQYIRAYNNAFAFTSFGVTRDEELSTRTRGIYTFRAQGQVYHYINSLYPVIAPPSYLQLYFYDTENEVQNRLNFSKPQRKQNDLPSYLDPNIVTCLIDILAPNPYSKFFRSLREIPNLSDHQIRIRADPILDVGTSSAPTASQVAAIWIENTDNPDFRERDILVYQHDGNSQRVRYYFGCYDSLQYPLLFPLGEPGWHQGIEKVTQKNRSLYSNGQEAVLPTHSATANELLATESLVFEENATKANMVSAREFYAYRFQIRPTIDSIILQSARLLQQYSVDMYIKIETSRLDYFRRNQDDIRADLYQGIVDSVAQGETKGSKVGKRIILPGSFIGGPRDMRKRYLDAMTLVERYGKPDIFLTMTCNPKWFEITSELQPLEQAQNRPDLVTRIFKSKLEELKKEVIRKQLFGPVAAFTYVIEFQKRGLPHVHMLLILKKGFKLNNPARFDDFVSAEIPDKEQNPHLYKMVITHMMQGPCGELNENNICMKSEKSKNSKKCKNQYPRKFTDETTMANDGYPIYKRRADGKQAMVRGHLLDNRWVVPYNPYLLAMFDCHLNVEICSTIKAVKYLYKYMYKGHDKVIFRIVNQHTSQDYDEISEFQSARWVSPPEAMWRIFRFALHDMNPAVISLQLHLEDCQIITFRKSSRLDTIADSEFFSRTMLTQFFYMNSHHDYAKSKKILYRDFPTAFVYEIEYGVYEKTRM